MPCLSLTGDPESSSSITGDTIERLRVMLHLRSRVLTEGKDARSLLHQVTSDQGDDGSEQTLREGKAGECLS